MREEEGEIHLALLQQGSSVPSQHRAEADLVAGRERRTNNANSCFLIVDGFKARDTELMTKNSSPTLHPLEACKRW